MKGEVLNIKLFLSWILASNLLNKLNTINKSEFITNKEKQEYRFKSKFFKNMYIKFSMLNLPYNITFKKSIVLVLLISIFLSVVSLFTYKNFLISVIYLLIPIILFQIIINHFNNYENSKIVLSLNLMVENLIQLINSNLPIKVCIENIQSLIYSKRFKKYYQKFIINYKSFGYNLPLSIKVLEDNFICEELTIFIETLKNYDNDDCFLDSLAVLNEILIQKENEMILKKLNKKKIETGICVVLLLVNCIVIILYPLINDIKIGVFSILK